MPEFLTVWDAIFTIVAVLIIFILIRLIQYLSNTDFFLSWSHIINPGILVVIVLGGVIFTRKTERVWHNLAAINAFQVNNLTDDWPHLGKLDSVSRVKAKALYLEKRKSWPIALIKNPNKVDSMDVQISELTDKIINATFIRSDTVFWDKENDTLMRSANRVLVFDSTKNFVHALDSQVINLRDSVLFRSAPYTMKIDQWIVSDTLRVRLNEALVPEEEEISDQ